MRLPRWIPLAAALVSGAPAVARMRPVLPMAGRISARDQRRP